MTGNPTENAKNETTDRPPRQVAQEYDFGAQHEFLSELVKKGKFWDFLGLKLDFWIFFFFFVILVTFNIFSGFQGLFVLVLDRILVVNLRVRHSRLGNLRHF